MFFLVVAVFVFVSIQLLPFLPACSDRLVQRLDSRWGVAYGAASALSVVLMIAAWRASPAIPLYDPPLWSRMAGFILVLLAFIAMGIFLFRGRLRQLIRWPWPLAITLALAVPLVAMAGHDLLSVLAGVALYGVGTQLHGIVAGVPVLTLSG